MFVALDLPASARSALAGWRDSLVEEALHVTLVFLGWQDEQAAPAIAEAAFGAVPVAETPRLRPAEVRPLPPHDPRLFALDLDDTDDRARAVQGAVSNALEAGRWYRPEKRPFWPHVTLARVKRGERRVPPLPGEPVPPAAPFEARELTLYRSTLRPQGALYEALARTTL
jgi:RNA 2',3'-cyclic 3'-phosphodiesterase